MKKSVIATLAIILGVALCWAAPPVDKLPSLLTTPAEARNISVIVGGSPPSSGPAPGTLLLGNNNTTTSPNAFTGNQNTAYMMCHTGQATATATTAYFYDSGGYETDPVHVCVWNTSGTLLDCSDNIVTTASPGWRNAAISVSITQGTSYVIGMVCSDPAGCFTNYDESSPALPQMTADTEGVTFGSEGSVTISTCDLPSGSFTIYITN